MGMLTAFRQRLHALRSDLVTAKYRLFGEKNRTLTVDDVEAEFKVASHAEQWRVEQCMGEQDIVERFLGDVNESDEVWDVGAAVGTYAVLAAKKAQHVTAFEPESRNYRRLQENVDLNELNNVTVRNVALSDREQTLRMERADGYAGGGAHQIDGEGDIEISAMRGVDITETSPDVIKIDVEGYELSVLDGMDTKLDGCRVIFVEVHLNRGVTVEKVTEKLETHGFTVGELPHGSRSERYIRGEQE